jgi:hypothetical protein
MLGRMVRRVLGCAAFLAIGLAGLIAPAMKASSEGFVLRPRYQAGDRYALSLSVDTGTRVDARGGTRDAFRENVELHYTAQVEVLETDAAGLPVRERHEGVELASVRPEGKRSLFEKGAAFELTRHRDGGVEIQFHDERADPAIEKIVGELLVHQSEYALAALLDPGRPVNVGERWELDPARVDEFLKARGIRAVALEKPADAVLSGGGRDPVVVRYRIPIRDFALPELPEGSSASDSEGTLAGEVKLDASGLHRVRAHTSKLELDIDGTLTTSGRVGAGRWHLRRSQSVAQHTETLKDQLASER